NQSQESKWFLAIIVAQLLAAVFAFISTIFPQAPIRLAALFSLLATTFIAWLQVKRHQELAQSYNLATQELGIIAINAAHIHTDEELSKFVADAENAISREHTMWVARRDQS